MNEKQEFESLAALRLWVAAKRKARETPKGKWYRVEVSSETFDKLRADPEFEEGVTEKGDRLRFVHVGCEVRRVKEPEEE